MIVSWNWLTDYLRLDMSAEALAERLALTGLNHEGTEEVGGDLAIDLEVTSNRADCLGHIGVAREIAVNFGLPLKVRDPRPTATGSPASSAIRVDVEVPNLCPRFTARVVRGVRVAESPWWLRKRLETLGVRSINNVVDVTNYVLFESGQPLHAYDLPKLAGRRLVVRHARAGEKLMAINGKTYDLTSDMITIADDVRPVGLAGVMGGLDTEISAATRDVAIESAQFDAATVRRTSRALALFSPSSHRFERGLDPEKTEWSSRRCVEMILDLAGGELAEGLVDVGTPIAARPPIRLRLDQIPRILGISIDESRVVAILQALGLTHEGNLTFAPPSWRADLDREIDLIEEVARIHGYQHIPENVAVPVTASSRGARERVEGVIRETLTACGFDEAVTYSLVPEEFVAAVESPGDPTPIRVEHSSRKRETILRPSLMPSLLAVRAHNAARGAADASLFEIAHVYRPQRDNPRPLEPTRLGIVSGLDFQGIKGVVEAIRDRLHIREPLVTSAAEHPLFAPGRSASLAIGGVDLGVIGEVAPGRLDDFGLKGTTSAAELAFDLLLDRADLIPRARPLPLNPAIARDVSLVLPVDVPWSELEALARSSAGSWLEGLTYLDTFRGGNLPDGHQSVHFGLRFRHPDRTLTGEEADEGVRSVVDACASRLGATLRG